MVALFDGKPRGSLSTIRYSTLCKKVSAAKNFFAPERLPPTTSAMKHHALRCYLQVMQWMGMDETLDPREWGWDNSSNILDPVMMDTAPAPEALLKMIHCNCSGSCSTLRCTCSP
jgi:hypothetical protein